METGDLRVSGTGQDRWMGLRELVRGSSAGIGLRRSVGGAMALICAVTSVVGEEVAEDGGPGLSMESEGPSLWAAGVGEGFHPDAQLATFSLGVNVGFARRAYNDSHHLAIASFSYGKMLSSVLGAGHWYGGNFELRGDLFAGGQFSPSGEWFVGLTPLVRYNFATGTRLVPFVGGGLGVTATSIGDPDLSGTFQFNERCGIGAHWFARNDLAWTGELFFTHWSNGGVRHPNAGLNGFTCLLGMTWLF